MLSIFSLCGAPGVPVARPAFRDEGKPQRKGGRGAGRAPARGCAARVRAGAGRGARAAAAEVSSRAHCSRAPPSISAPRGRRSPLDQRLHLRSPPGSSCTTCLHPETVTPGHSTGPSLPPSSSWTPNTARALLSPQRPPPLGSLQHSAGQMAAPRLRGRHQ